MSVASTIETGVMKTSRFSDVFLAGLVVLIISLMIIPIPPFVMDILIAVNLTIAVTLLMMSMYIPQVLAFSTFPSMLLFTTLFRLALNISATRLILLYAYAGDIIFTFGNFVVAGNFIVGAVIFLIILIVQFLVITKGAERVAEVAARFTLDAMPGKQMSIDADLRAGNIDLETAKKKRGNLEKENQLYGSMDGAMKFVKGDAIAGLIITAINIVAGLAIGVTQKGMDISKAVKTYSILTIGDGLVSQIPALLISITAGIIVTRVSSDNSPPLGKDIGDQLLGQPKALILGGIMAFILMLVPGLPKIPFVILGSGIITIGYVLKKTKSDGLKRGSSKAKGMAAATAKASVSEKKEESDDDFSITVPLILDVSSSIETTIEPDVLNQQLTQVRRALYHDLGVPFPGIHLRFNENLTSGFYQILLQEVPMTQGNLPEGYVIARESKENLDIMGVPYREEARFLPHVESLWVKNEDIPKLEKANIPYMKTPQILTYHLSFVLKRYAGDFIGIQETRFLLENMEKTFPEVVKEVQRILPVQKIAEILQRLVQEEISIRNLRLVLQCLIEWGQKEKEPVLLTDYVRTSLRRYISYKFSCGKNILPVYMLELSVEDVLRKAIRQTSAGSYLALDPPVARRLLENIKKEVGDIGKFEHKPVLLASMDVRRYLRKFIELELHELPVLSHQELTEEITIRPLGRIGL